MNFTPAERETDEGHLKFLRIEVNSLKKAEQKGIEKGLEKGIAKGMKHGIEQEKINTAKNMFATNLAIALISELTGLSVDEIQAL